MTLGPRYVLWNVSELSRTITRFHKSDDKVADGWPFTSHDFFEMANRKFLKCVCKSAFGNSPPFGTNLHFRHLPQNFNLTFWLTVLTNWLKWRFVQKMGRVADGWCKFVCKVTDSLGFVWCGTDCVYSFTKAYTKYIAETCFSSSVCSSVPIKLANACPSRVFHCAQSFKGHTCFKNDLNESATNSHIGVIIHTL